MTKNDMGVDDGVRLGQPSDLRGVLCFSHEAMATVYEVYTAHADRQYAAQAAQACFDLVDRLERDLSRFLPNSDISRINHLAASGSTRVASSTLECLVIARHMFDLTDGAFDVSLGTGLPSLRLDTDDAIVHATANGVRLDLGGIGKGYAVDAMAEMLEEWDLPASLVHGGCSSVLALDPPPGREGWPLTLSDPRDGSRILERLSVRQIALAASGVRRRDHIIDPRTGNPVRNRRAAWVALGRPTGIAAAAVADAMTTACMLLGWNQIERLCRNSPGAEAWVLQEDGLRHLGAIEQETHHGW
jgi:thiamine biosynthesis lipoprotein